jgi:SPP1 family predicted phage head-tail adaptor
MDIGKLRHRVTLATPGDPVPDGDGGATVTWTTLAARRAASVQPATAHALERLMAKTTETIATHIVTVRYLPGVTTKTRVTFHDGATDRLLYVAGVFDLEERHEALALTCNEATA